MDSHTFLQGPLDVRKSGVCVRQDGFDNAAGLSRNGGFACRGGCDVHSRLTGIVCERKQRRPRVPLLPAGSRQRRLKRINGMIAGHLLLLASLIGCAARVRGHFPF